MNCPAAGDYRRTAVPKRSSRPTENDFGTVMSDEHKQKQANKQKKKETRTTPTLKKNESHPRVSSNHLKQKVDFRNDCSLDVYQYKDRRLIVTKFVPITHTQTHTQDKYKHECKYTDAHTKRTPVHTMETVQKHKENKRNRAQTRNICKHS